MNRYATMCGICVSIIISIVIHALYNRTMVYGQMICIHDISTGKNICRPECEHGYYSLSGMETCHPWLNCDGMKELTYGELLGFGAVKKVYKGSWHGHEVAINILHNTNYTDDFNHGLEMIKSFQPSHHVVQLIGFCNFSYVTQFHPLGTANKLDSIFQSSLLQKFDNVSTRFKMCISYVEAIHFLHTSPIGARVMCDSNDPDKALSQCLLNVNMDIVLNDLDALPKVDSENGLTIKCGHKELFGDFVAPEQLWPFDDLEFNDSLMPGYNEKTDIWKIPDVCNRMLGKTGNQIKLHLLEIHSKCKNEKPSQRPSAFEVLKAYTNTFHLLNGV